MGNTLKRKLIPACDLTWEEFSWSKDVCNTLRRRPTLKDYIDYKHNKLTIVGEGYIMNIKECITNSDVVIKRYKEMLCKDIERVKNFEKARVDGFKGWVCHHRLETHTSDGERRPVDILAAELKALDMYEHRPPEELIFLTASEHRKLHSEYINK